MSQTQTQLSGRLAKAAQDLIKTPFQRQGRTREGLDCVGLVLMAAQSVGVDLSAHDETTYGAQPNPVRLRQRLDAAFNQAQSLGVGSVLLINIPDIGTTHVGVVAERNGVLTFVHASDSRGEVIEHRLDGATRKKINTIYELKG